MEATTLFGGLRPLFRKDIKVFWTRRTEKSKRKVRMETGMILAPDSGAR